jgi:photosystem II stability/assembly factor-like uncharacterized protein
MHNVLKRDSAFNNLNKMKILLQIFLFLIAGSAYSQNIWEPINFSENLYTRAINAEKAGILLVATEEVDGAGNLNRSYDDGNTWDILDVDPINSCTNIFTIRYNLEGVLFVGANGTIYRSFDDGNSFEQVYSGGDNILNIDFSPSNEIFAVGWTNILRSSDNGNTWDTLYSGGNQFFADIDFGLNGEIYAVGGVYEAPGSGFYRSFDDGVTWENVGITDSHLYSVKVIDDGVIIVGGDMGLLTSNDRGQTWNYVINIFANALETNGFGNIFSGQNNLNSGCWVSNDHGETWLSLVDTIINPYINQISISPDNSVYVQSEKLSPYNHQLFKSIVPIVGIKSQVVFPDIEFYPNPATSKIVVLNRTQSKIIQFVIYDQTGLQILRGPLVDFTIDVAKLQPGVYIIEFEMQNSKVNKKIIIE